LKADPTQSNRRIGDATNASHVTVGAVREELETTGQIDQLDKTTGADGKKRKRKGGTRKADTGTGKKKEKEKIEYQKVSDPITANKAYQLFEQHLLDALKELSEFSTFDYAKECAEGTIDKLERKLTAIVREMQPEENEAA
jgi:hypothetical protein